MIVATNTGGALARATLQGLGHCEQHRRKAKLGDFMTDEGWAIVAAEVLGHTGTLPAKLLTRLEWTPIH